MDKKRRKKDTRELDRKRIEIEKEREREEDDRQMGEKDRYRNGRNVGRASSNFRWPLCAL